jgi:hypothetical protein
LMLPLLAMTPGCKKVVEAPDDLEELVVYSFVNFDNEDAEVLVAAEANIIPEVNTHEDEMAEGFLVNSLTAADLEAVGVTDPDVTEIVGALGVVDYRHSLDEVLGPITSENKDQIFDNFLEFEILEQGDRDCFLSGECERFDQKIHEVTNVQLIGDADRTYTNSLRWLNGEETPRAVMIRQLNPDPVEFEGSALNMTVFQQYSFVLLYEEGGHARRVEAFWVDFELVGMNVPDNFAVANSVNQMAAQAEKIDAYLDGN